MGGLIWFSQILCLCFILLHFQVQCSSLSRNSPPHLCRPQEQSALLDFKTTISAGNWCFGHRTIQTWNRSIDCCLWEGITCNNITGHVIGLDLSYSCITTNLPINSSLFRLEKLQSLNLAYSTFSYPNISFGFHTWKSLTYLNLTGTGLIHSSLLFEISLLLKLVSLDLSQNSLLLDNTRFQMLVHNLTDLRHLILDSVNMSSVVPSSLLNLTSSLERLSLKRCALQGNFPTQFFHLPSLQFLDLSENYNLGGNLPKSNWSSPLKYLDIYGTRFLGELSYSLGNLKLLEHLSLTDCQFSGSIPASLANLTEITYLDFSSNHLHGHIPNVFEKMYKLSSLDLAGNNFSGEIPTSIFNLTHLTYLELSNNWLIGSLPDNTSGLSYLLEFWIYSNLLTGRVPSWLFSLPSLVLLNLMNNKIIGPIDHIQKPSQSLEEVFLLNNEISGLILASFFDLMNLREVDLSSNNLSGTITPNMLSKLVNLANLDLSNNRLLSLSNNSTDVNYSFPTIWSFKCSSCNIHKFPSFLKDATRLEHLDISKNKISGEIHKWEIERMSLVSLSLSHNFLTGIELPALESLWIVDLRFNLLQGSLPILSMARTFSHLLISGNNLTGEIPSSYCNLTSLQVLDLANNSLGGKIPECLGNISHLYVLDLQMNKFHGRIPNLFVNNSLLRTLNLNGNLLEGGLPPSLVNCSSLEVLDVGNNYLNDTFPHWLGVLLSLRVLILRSNQFHGPISNFMPAFYFPQLRIIDVSQNKFMGLLPSNYFKNLKAITDVARFEKAKLEYIGHDLSYYDDTVTLTMKGSEVVLVRILVIFTTIDFSSNLFHGPMPAELGELSSLLLLNLSHNSLTGQIPSSLGKIIELESLDLSSNEIDGRIPEQLTNLTFLSVLNLSHNKLMDHIPQGKQFDTFSNDSYIGNSKLCGLPLTKKCNNGEEPEPPPSKIDEEDDFATLFEWKFALAGYGCGLVLGLSLGYIVFTTGKPWWLVKKVEENQQRLVGRCNHRHKKRKAQQPNQGS